MVELSNAGVSVVAICRPSTKIEEYLTAHHVTVRHLPNSRKVSLSSLIELRKILEEYHVENVHVHVHRDVWLPAIALQNDVHRKLFVSVYMGVNSKNDFLHRWAYRRIDGMFCSSPEMTPRLPSLYPIGADKVHLLPYGRHLERYNVDTSRRAAIRSQLGAGDDQLLVGTMLRIDPGKGVMDFARSFLYLKPELRQRVKFLIVGEPTRKGRTAPGASPYEPHCEAYLQQLEAYIVEEKLSQSIHRLDYQPDLIGYLSALDCFVFPSRDELYSLVVLDAMAMGLPVVAARAGGNMWQVKDNQNGLLYDVADSKDLAAKLEEYIMNPTMRQKHGVAARAFVSEDHDMKNTIQQLLSFYHAA